VPQPLDHERLRRDLDTLGGDPAARGVFVELAL